METTDWLLLALVLVGHANWVKIDGYGGELQAAAALGIASLAVLFDLDAIDLWSREAEE